MWYIGQSSQWRAFYIFIADTPSLDFSRSLPGVTFINFLLPPFSYKSALHSFYLFSLFGFVIFWHKNIGAKAACKMLMN
jgi:hypothetical protein